MCNSVKKILKEKNIIYYCLYFFILIICMCVMPAISADEYFKYWVTDGITEGKIVYKDLNIITTPLIYIVAAFFLKIYNSIWTIRLLNICVWFTILVLVHKIVNTKSNNFFIFTINVLSIILLNVSYSFYYDYNSVCLLFTLIIIYLLLRKELSYKNIAFISFILGLIFYTKQTTGIFILLATCISIYFLNKKSKKDTIVKIIVINVIVFMMICLFVFLLYYYGILTDFFDLTIKGGVNFTRNFSISVSTYIFALILIYCFFICGLDNKKSDLFNTENLIYLVFVIFNLCIAIPIFDIAHVYPAFLILMFIMYNLKGTVKIKYISLLYFIMFIISFRFYLINTEKNLVKINNENFKNVYVTKLINETVEYMEEIYIKYPDKKVYLIDKYSVIYYSILNNEIDFFTLLWNGNIGNKNIIEYVSELSQNGIYIIDKNKTKYSQWDSRIYDYIEQNYNLIEENNNWQVYTISN